MIYLEDIQNEELRKLRSVSGHELLQREERELRWLIHDCQHYQKLAETILANWKKEKEKMATLLA
jgi:hypothetical protein